MTLTVNQLSLKEAVQAARAEGNTITGKNTERGVDLPEAYQIQATTGSNRPLKGYKFGLISAAKQQQMGINTPLYGRIYADMLHQSPLALSNFIQPRLEPEIAIQLEHDIAPDALPGDTLRAIGGFVLGIDILDSVWTGYKFTASEVVADNTSGGGFVLGPTLFGTLPGGNLRLYLNGQLQTEGPVAALGDPVQKLQWLAGQVNGLKAGQVIFLGSPAASIPAASGTLELVDDAGHTLIVKLSA